MKLFISAILSFCLLQKTFSQSFRSDTSVVNKLIMVDSFTTNIKSIIVSPTDIQTITVLKNNTAFHLFGDKAKEGAILFTLKENIHLMRLNEILNMFNFPDSERSLRVCINDVIVDKPELIVANLNEIASIGTFYSVDANCSTGIKEEKLINIIPKKR